MTTSRPRQSWISTIFQIFSGAWNSIWHLCWSGGDGIDSPYAMFNSALFGLPSMTPLDRRKIRGPKVPTTVPDKPQSCFLTSTASTSHIWTCTYPGWQLSLVSLFFSGSYWNRISLYSWTQLSVKLKERKLGPYIQTSGMFIVLLLLWISPPPLLE